ncbi:MAG: hypothetical protein C0409_02345 [Novosphingobium sp.]|nr:hypothetical protein [Novosphingobium sp.]
MKGNSVQRSERRRWSIAAGVALGVHAGVAVLALAWVAPADLPVPEPVVLVELPEEASAATTAVAAAAAPPQSRPEPVVQQAITPPPVEAPVVRAPLPAQALALPARMAMPPAAAPQAVSAPAATPVAVAPIGRGAGTSTLPGTDVRARQQEVDYFSLVSAHLNRRKVYPAEAKKARQQGVVTVRFTVDRNGSVTAAAIKQSSGHTVLDQATLDLLQRVAPLPRMPGSMQRERITLSLPIDYSLRTS